jgi:membrane fusion protein (multidrug efflux system)
MKVKYIIYTVLIVGFAALIVYRISKGKNQEKGGGGRPGAMAGTGGVMPAMNVNGFIVKPTSFSNSLSVSGSIDANEQVQVRSEVSGLVREIFFTEGSSVSKGQALLRIDDSELQAQLAQALTKQKLASETERRAKQLLEKEAISKEEYDVALADLRSLQAQTQLIRAQLAKTRVQAPFSGRIGLRSISAGEYLTPTTVVANLVNTNPVKVTFSIPEKYSSQVKMNSAITFTVSGSHQKYKAQVYAIEPGIDANTRTLQLRARANNPNGELLPGSFAKVDLPLSNIENAILIPSEAIIPVLKGRKVFISNNGKAKEVMIETDTRTESAVLVRSGLKAGDTVLTTGIMALKQDAPVKVDVVNK